MYVPLTISSTALTLTCQVGTTRHQIQALNLQERDFEERKSGLVFFDNYYGRVTFNLSNDQRENIKTELPVFPILVRQPQGATNSLTN